MSDFRQPYAVVATRRSKCQACERWIIPPLNRSNIGPDNTMREHPELGWIHERCFLEIERGEEVGPAPPASRWFIVTRRLGRMVEVQTAEREREARRTYASIAHAEEQIGGEVAVFPGASLAEVVTKHPEWFAPETLAESRRVAA